MDKGNRENMKNIIYMIKLIFQASPLRIFISIIREVIDKIFYVFFYVYLIQYIYLCIQKNEGFNRLVIIIVLACIGHTILHIFTVWYQYYLSKTEPKIYEYIYLKVINKALEMELKEIENPEFYDKYTRALNEVIKRSDEVLKTLTQGIAALTGVIATVSFIIYVDAFLLIFSVFPLIGTYIFGKKKNKLIYRRDMEITCYNRKIDYVKRVFYEKKYAQELRLFNIKNVFFREHDNNYNESIKILEKYRNKIAIINAVQPIIMEVGVLVSSLIYISYKILIKGSMSAANCVALINAIGTVSQDIRVLVSQVADFNKHSMYIRNIKEFLEYIPNEENYKFNTINDFKNIVLKDVSYTYSGHKNPSINKINMTIKKGEKIVIVGHNGAGKTTLIKLIMRLYDVSNGEILINDENIKNYNKNIYKDIFSVILQDYQIYALSLAENVLMDSLKCEEEVIGVEEALKKSGFEEKLRTLKKGVNSTLTKEFSYDGRVFSGGEYQKIAIARVFDKNSDILILDEPSSALDPIAEFYMYEKIMEESKDKTIIFISHRLSVTRMADKIYMLENGEIIEEGSHKELMKLNRKYAEMFKKQAEKYVDLDDIKVSV